MKFKLILLPLCFIVIHAFAFEGTVKQVIKNFNGTGVDIHMTWYLGAHNCRVDMAVATKDVNSNTVLLLNPATKTLTTYDAGGTQKTYMQVNAGSITGDMSVTSATATQEVKQILGYNCTKWVVVTSAGTYNMWITRDIDFDWLAYKEFFKSSAEIVALAQQGVKGFPMLTETADGKNSSAVEAVAAQSLAASTFAVPQGYALFDPHAGAKGK